MKQLKPRVVRDFRGQDYVQTSNVCGNTTYVRNYEVLRPLDLQHMNTYFSVLGFIVTLDDVLDREVRFMEILDYIKEPYNPKVKIDVLSPYAQLGRYNTSLH